MSAPSDSLGKDARALIRAARGGDDVPPEERRQLLEAFARSRAAEGAARPPRAWSRRRTAPPLGWAVAALVLTGSLAALAQNQGLFQRLGAWIEDARLPAQPTSSAAVRDGARGGSHVPLAPPPSMAPSSAEASSTPSSELALPIPALQHEPSPPAARERAPRASARRGPASAAPALSLAQRASSQAFDPAELELIAAARTALAERHFDTARQHAERHASRFPQGAFSEEREAILALSECRSQQGNQRGQRFVQERPAALLAERVRRDCGLGANLVPGAAEPDTH